MSQINKETFISSVVRPFILVLDKSVHPSTFVGFNTSYDGSYMTIEVNNIKTKKDLAFIIKACENSFGNAPKVYERQGLGKRPHYYAQYVQPLE